MGQKVVKLTLFTNYFGQVKVLTDLVLIRILSDYVAEFMLCFL